jgi:hypothetical protein
MPHLNTILIKFYTLSPDINLNPWLKNTMVTVMLNTLPVIELSRILRETLMDRFSLIDILSLNVNTLFKVKPPDNPQLKFF